MPIHRLPPLGFGFLPLVKRFPDLNARFAVVTLEVFNVPHHSTLILPFGFLVKTATGRGRIYPNIESDFPETRRANLQGNHIDVSSGYTRLKDVPI